MLYISRNEGEALVRGLSPEEAAAFTLLEFRQMAGQ